MIDYFAIYAILKHEYERMHTFNLNPKIPKIQFLKK